MHVHDLNPKKALATIIIFVIIIILGFVTLKRPKFIYKVSLQESIELLKDKNAYFYPWQLVDVINKVDNNIVLIDIRDIFSYGQGHIPGSENISAYDLTSKKYIEYLNRLNAEGKTVVLYGNDQLEANGPWMWFKQVGYENFKVLLGGYKYYLAHKDNLEETKSDKSYILEVPDFNFAEVANKGASIQSTTKNTKVPVIKRKKKKTVAAGGC